MYEQKNLRLKNNNTLYNLFFPQGILDDSIINKSSKAFKIIFFGFSTRIILVTSNSEKIEVKKKALGERRKWKRGSIITVFS